MALAIRTHTIPQLLRNNIIVCLHFLIYKLPTNNNGCVSVGWCDVSECADSGELTPMLHTRGVTLNIDQKNKKSQIIAHFILM